MLFARLTSRWVLGWLAASLGVPLRLAAALLAGRTLTPDPVRLALDGSLRIALDRDLVLRAFERLERERRPLRAERLEVQEARQRLVAGQ